MNTKDHPLPNSGGSYMRNADGSLTRVDEDGNPIVDEPEAEIAVSAQVEAVAEKPTRAARSAGPALTEKDV